MIKQNKHFCHLIRGEGILPKIFAESQLKISAEGEFGGRVVGGLMNLPCLWFWPFFIFWKYIPAVFARVVGCKSVSQDICRMSGSGPQALTCETLQSHQAHPKPGTLWVSAQTSFSTGSLTVRLTGNATSSFGVGDAFKIGWQEH